MQGELPNRSDDLVGQVVGGRYRIVNRIGEGGMGVVYKAEQQLGSATRFVAVKTLHSHFSQDPSVTARFHREVGTIAQLEHPNTVRVYDFGSTADGTLYIAMEFLAGRSLGQIVESEGPLSLERTGRIVQQVAGSLDEAHRQGVVHRDLKPENVLLIERAGEKDVVKLVDFGIAARTESTDRDKEQKLTQAGMVLGTPPYMSPEQFTGKALDPRSDVYSLGIMTYEMLTGRLPFEGDTPWQWATAHMTLQPRAFDAAPNASAIPEGARRAVLKALSKDPTQRQNTAGQFCRELLEAGTKGVPVAPRTEAMAQAPEGPKPTEAMPMVAAAAVAVPPAPPRQAAHASTGRNMPLIWGLGAVAGVLGIAIAVLALSNGEDTEPVAVLTPVSETAAPTTVTAEPAPAVSPTPDPGKLELPTPVRDGTTTPASTPKPPASRPSAETKPAASPSSAPQEPSPSRPPTPSTAPTKSPTPSGLPPGLPQLPGLPTSGGTASPAPTAPAPSNSAPQPAAARAQVDSCRACLDAVSSGNLGAAAQHYRTCQTPVERTNCQKMARGRAQAQARTAALNGKCAEAQGILASAAALGVDTGSPAFADARNCH